MNGVGIDWATDAHEVCILTPRRELVSQRKVEHNGSALAAFVDHLMRLCEDKAARVIIAIEIPRGADPLTASRSFSKPRSPRAGRSSAAEIAGRRWRRMMRRERSLME